LGQSNDYTALSVLEKLQQEGEIVYHLRWLERVQGEPYPNIINKVLALMRSSALQNNVVLVVDSTGVGAPVVDAFRAAGLKQLISIFIDGGNDVTQESLSYRVPKRDLVGVIKILLQNNRLLVSKELKLGPLLQDELLSFNYKLNPLTAHDFYGVWREGKHDDLVLSVSLAAWYGEYGPKPPAKLGVISLRPDQKIIPKYRIPGESIPPKFSSLRHF
jgi:hypothetical protein